MRSDSRQRRGLSAWVLCLGALGALASVPGGSSAQVAKPVHVGDVTYVSGTTARVVGKAPISPGGSNAVKATRSIQGLNAGDILQAGDGTVQFNVRNGQQHAYCKMNPNAVVQLRPTNVLVDFVSGTTFCATDPTGGKKTMKIGPYVTATATDPVFEVTASSSTKTLKVNEGALVVGGKSGGRTAVV